MIRATVHLFAKSDAADDVIIHFDTDTHDHAWLNSFAESVRIARVAKAGSFFAHSQVNFAREFNPSQEPQS